jgi:hypothetical protein
MESKKFWESKTMWVNVIAAAAVVIQTQTGFIVGPELQALALTVLNLFLRSITEKPLEW